MKTDLGKIFTVSGEQGLFQYVAQAARGAILESLSTKKRFVAGPSAKMSALTDISIYTTSEEVKLQDVFEAMKKQLGEEKAPSGKSAPEQLKEFFGKVIPDYDGERFYPSHMKKVVEWYNFLKEYASLDFMSEEEIEAERAKGGKVVEKEESAKSAAAKATKGAEKQKSAKVSTKQAPPAKASVPRKVV